VIEIGKAYLFQTVTHYLTGRVVALSPTHATLDDAAWIPDTGRLNECVAKGTHNECEPLGDGVLVPVGSTIVIPWRHDLPKKVK
jgi:hypothetical protein